MSTKYEYELFTSKNLVHPKHKFGGFDNENDIMDVAEQAIVKDKGFVINVYELTFKRNKLVNRVKHSSLLRKTNGELHWRKY